MNPGYLKTSATAHTILFLFSPYCSWREISTCPPLNSDFLYLLYALIKSTLWNFIFSHSLVQSPFDSPSHLFPVGTFCISTCFKHVLSCSGQCFYNCFQILLREFTHLSHPSSAGIWDLSCWASIISRVVVLGRERSSAEQSSGFSVSIKPEQIRKCLFGGLHWQ